MFNLAAFNRTPFNRPLSIETFFTAIFEADSELVLGINLDMAMDATFEIKTEILAYMTRETPFKALFETSTELLTGMIRERIFSAKFEPSTEFISNQKIFHIEEIEFVGEFKPGDKIVIDSEKYKITRNGENVSHLYNGDFFDLNLGINNLTWTDPVTGRTVLFRITYRDRMLY
ncbi:phage distal tail protein [Paenibacillus segetis]|uniref:Siphovirus-type tail component C-terminal domain-containing protein n=1 Tax=Paenibacillus segetis TaxID=1325360 RepID=A0ABQ1Y9H3_9BACL|nr:phage tail domain-containing protein [Paenibacillus segetis]GGH17396.1 hypothetical protein GCM10008013_12700 [Paenibacillus segetis]